MAALVTSLLWSSSGTSRLAATLLLLSSLLAIGVSAVSTAANDNDGVTMTAVVYDGGCYVDDGGRGHGNGNDDGRGNAAVAVPMTAAVAMMTAVSMTTMVTLTAMVTLSFHFVHFPSILCVLGMMVPGI